MIQVFAIVAATLCCIADAQIPRGVGVAYGHYIPVNNSNNQTNQTRYGWANPNNQPRVINQSQPQYNQPQPQYNQPPPPYNQPSPPYIQPAYNQPATQAFPAASQSSPLDLVMGAREDGDTVLFKTIIRKSPSWYTSSVAKAISFPDPSSKARIQRITQIIVHDNKSGKGGHTQVVSGGVSRNYVNFNFKNYENRPLDLQLTIYGMDTMNRRIKK